MHCLQTIKRLNEQEVERIMKEGEEARRRADAKFSDVVRRAIDAGAANKAVENGQPAA